MKKYLQPYFEDIETGSEIPPLVRHITLVQMVMYQAATWDFFLGHYDHEFSRARGFPKPFMDGQMLGSLLGQLLTEWHGPDGSVKRIAFRNAGLVFPGDTLTLGGKVVRKYAKGMDSLIDLELWCLKQDGSHVASGACATVKVPPLRGKQQD